jgi:hypothetical protein
LYVSKPTATTRTMPATMSWIGDEKPMKLRPYAREVMTRAPRTAPEIVPTPPENDVPPMTAAAITYSSYPWPRSSVALFSRATAIEALTAQRIPMRMNVFMIVQRVLMPPSSAASGLPPIAKT